MAKLIQNKQVMRAPDGAIGLVDQSDVASFRQRGYSDASDQEAESAQQAAISEAGPLKAIQSGLADAPALDATQALTAAGETIKGAATFGLAGPRDEQAQLRAQLFEEQYPISSMAAQAVPSIAMYAALPGLAAAESAAGRAAAFLGRAGIEGSMYAGEAARREGRDFSYTEAAVAGITGEVFGAALGWTATRAAGGYRNLVQGATQRSVARDVEKGLGGGWLKDYQAAAYADDYVGEAARAATKDLDGVLTDFPEVASIARKRDRIAEVISRNPNGQRAFASDLSTKLTELRQTLADTAGEGGGPAKSLFKDLDNIIEEWHSLSANLRQTDGQEIFKQADRLRQTVHEYVAEIAQDIYDDPARAILSKDGLRTLEGFRDYLVNGLKDGNVWGQAAADFQKVYNEAFHKKFFPAQKIVNGRLMQVTGKDARGFAVRQAEPGKIMRLLKREATAEETAAGLSAEMTRTHFNNWLDGIETIALEAAGEAPDKAKKLLNHVQRLRNTAVVGDQIQDAVTRHGKRVAFGEAAGGAALGVAALGDVSGAVAGALILRRGVSGVRQMHWLGDALNSLGWFRGKKASIEAILNKGTDIIDRRIAGANLRQALKRPAKAMLPEGAPDEFYQLGKGPKALPPWEREIDLTNEAEFLGPHTLRPSDYALEDPAPTPRAMFENARTELPGGDTKQGMFVTRQEVEQLKADLRQSGPQGQKVADFLDEHDGELPHVGQPKVDVEAPTQRPPDFADLEDDLTSLPEPVNGFMSPANVGPAWPTQMATGDMRALGKLPDATPEATPNEFVGSVQLSEGPDLTGKLAAWKAEAQAAAPVEPTKLPGLQPWAPGARNAYIADLWDQVKGKFANRKEFNEELARFNARHGGLDRLDMVQAADPKKVEASLVPVWPGEKHLIDLDKAAQFVEQAQARPTPMAGQLTPKRELQGLQRAKTFNQQDFPDLKPEAGAQQKFMKERLDFNEQGVTPAGKYRGEDGKVRYIKVAQDPAQTLSEHLANRMLKDFGVMTNDSTLFELKQNGKTYLAYAVEWVDGFAPMYKMKAKLTKEAAKQYGRQIPIDTLFGNWDKLTNPGNVFTNGKQILSLDNGGAGVFHASGEYRFSKAKPGETTTAARRRIMNEGRAAGAGPLRDTDMVQGARQVENAMQPEMDWRRLENVARAEAKRGKGRIDIGPAEIMAAKLGIQDRKQLMPLFQEGFEIIQAVKQQYGGWFEYVEMRAKELPRQYKRDLVQLLTTREEWLRKNIPLLSVAPFIGLAAIDDLAESMDNAEKDGLASMPSEPWINSVESFRRDQEKLLSDTVSNLFGGNRRSRVLSSSVNRFKEDQPDLRTAFLEKRARLEALVNNPSEMVSRVTEGLRDMPQEAFAASAGGIGRTVAFLQSKFPQRPPEWQRDVPVNEIKMRQIAEYWDAATNPRGLMEDFRDTGRLTQPQLETLQALYPDQLLKLQAGIMEKLQDGPPPSLEARKQVERILGQTGAAEPAFSKTVSYAANLAFEQAAQVQTPPPAATPGVSKASASSGQPAGIAALRRA